MFHATLLVGAISMSGPAFPCAALVVEDGGSASTSAQEAIFQAHDGEVDVTYRVQVDNDVHQLGWIIPIYGDFLSLTDADPSRFDDLRELTAPDVWIEQPYASDDDAGCGCLGASKGSDAGGSANLADDTGSLGVTVVAEGFSGTFAYTVLEATSDAALMSWLTDHGYGIGPSGPAIATYVAEGGVQFIALDVDMDEAGDGTRELPAVRVRYQGQALRFPSLMAAYGMPEVVSTRVFVFADQRVTVGNGWSSEAFDYREGNGADADAAFRDQLYEIGGERPVFAEIWAGTHEGAFLTRLDLVADKDVHSSDAVFTANGGTSETRSELWLYGRTASWLMLPAALLDWSGCVADVDAYWLFTRHE